MAAKRYVIIRHPNGVQPGEYFPAEYENKCYDREEFGLNARVLVIPPATLCFPTGIKFRRSSDGAIADIYEPRIAALQKLPEVDNSE